MASDPVKDKSGFLCMYMSNHPDTLVSYVRYWGKVTAQVSSAKMTGIDTNGMDMTYQLKGSGESRTVRVPFDPPLSGYEEVKPRLMNMKGEAEEALGMIKSPQVTDFPLARGYITTAVAVSFLVYCTLAAESLSPSSELAPYAPYFAPGNTVLSFLPSWSLQFSWGMVVFCHSFEALYVLHLCRKHRTGMFVGAQYVIGTLLLGYPVIREMRQKVQDARIDSILKGK